MKLIVGLGNPGRRYEGTRHNVGFEVVQILARRWGQLRWKRRFDGRWAEGWLGGETCGLLLPQTYMNLSGRSAAAAVRFHKLSLDRVLVVCDDFSLPLARLRMRRKGSAGGQRGLGHILQVLGSQEVPRLRIGIGPVPPGWDPADFVLGRFTPAERERIEPAVETAADAAESWCISGIDATMSRYNTRESGRKRGAMPADNVGEGSGESNEPNNGPGER